MDAALQAKLEQMAFQGAITLFSIDPIYENDDGKLEFDPDEITARWNFLAERIERLGWNDEAAAIRQIADSPDARRAFVSSKVRVVQKATAKKRRTRDALQFAKRWAQEVQQLQESKGVTRKIAESIWLDVEMTVSNGNLHPRTPQYRRQRKNLRRRVDTARKFAAQGTQ